MLDLVLSIRCSKNVVNGTLTLPSEKVRRRSASSCRGAVAQLVEQPTKRSQVNANLLTWVRILVAVKGGWKILAVPSALIGKNKAESKAW